MKTREELYAIFGIFPDGSGQWTGKKPLEPSKPTPPDINIEDFEPLNRTGENYDS